MVFWWDNWGLYEGTVLIQVILVLNIAVLISLVLDLRAKEADRLFSFGVVRILFVLPLLAGSYFLGFFITEQYVHPFFFSSENVFSLLWLVLAYRLYCVTSSSDKKVILFRLLLLVCSAVVMVVAGYVYFYPLPGDIADGVLVFSHYGVIYCSALFLLVAVLILGWRFEAFWRSLEVEEKWRYKYLMLGLVLVCAMLGWSSSYRLAYLRLPREHLLLLAIVVIIAMLLMIYALARHRLLNRKLFVSRKVVYATITPIIFSCFLILVGVMSLFSRLYGWSVPYVLQWMIIILGALGISVLAFSGGVRRRVKYFISTHFYVNKYEYRDEWLAFSDLLQGKLTEKGVVEAMYQILRESVYTQTILIWLGDIQKGFRLVHIDGDQNRENDDIIAGDDAIVCYLHNAPYLCRQDGDADPLRRSILIEREAFLKDHNIVLMVPLILGGQCAGLIGLGPETSGGTYGHDDFDLLLALSSHAASALVAVQNAEKLARVREQSAYSNLSAFVLHDIKNAATMLDLVRSNAHEHMDNPEFQQDMLDSIDDALKRMGKVQTRLNALKGDMVPEFRQVDFSELLRACINKMTKNIPNLVIALECSPDLFVQTDPDLICRTLENLIINAWESGGDGTVVRIKVAVDTMIRVDIQDNGPGIKAELLPHALFEPLKTAKPNGSGIGLWQVRQFIEALGGDIQAQNADEGGALFILRFPNRSDLQVQPKP